MNSANIISDKSDKFVIRSVLDAMKNSNSPNSSNSSMNMNISMNGNVNMKNRTINNVNNSNVLSVSTNSSNNSSNSNNSNNSNNSSTSISEINGVIRKVFSYLDEKGLISRESYQRLQCCSFMFDKIEILINESKALMNVVDRTLNSDNRNYVFSLSPVSSISSVSFTSLDEELNEIIAEFRKLNNFLISATPFKVSKFATLQYPDKPKFISDFVSGSDISSLDFIGDLGNLENLENKNENRELGDLSITLSSPFDNSSSLALNCINANKYNQNSSKTLNSMNSSTKSTRSTKSTAFNISKTSDLRETLKNSFISSLSSTTSNSRESLTTLVTTVHFTLDELTHDNSTKFLDMIVELKPLKAQDILFHKSSDITWKEFYPIIEISHEISHVMPISQEEFRKIKNGITSLTSRMIDSDKYIYRLIIDTSSEKDVILKIKMKQCKGLLSEFKLNVTCYGYGYYG